MTTANYLYNRLPISPNSKTFEKAFIREKLSIAHLRVFGCLAYAYTAAKTCKKLNPNLVKTVFVSYKEST